MVDLNATSFNNSGEKMSQVFEGYERQYCELSANLSKKITSASLLDGERKKQKLSELNGGLEDAEALKLAPSVKATLLAKLREYKTDLNNLKTEVKRITSANVNQAARDELLESGMADTRMVSSDQRGRLMMSTEKLDKSGERIRESRKTMLETEELGVSILHDLHQQRQSLLHAHNTLIILAYWRLGLTCKSRRVVNLQPNPWAGPTLIHA
ncbi:hypothetical protein DH2020_043054 [Rehmannia glutinosa]|uniref:Vesicle transport v-SNARE N-terminal domain-containing protein n=1 Tax=Rehmannia glutinosa TaxID=99300 RepID=A0ABR0UKV9_REHGL